MRIRYKRFTQFLNTTLLGGLAVVLPLVITLFFLKWLFGFIVSLIAPISNALVTQSGFQEVVANLLVISVIVVSCFLIGVMIKTRLGKYIQHLVDTKLLKLIPGYKIVKETVNQFIHTDGKNSPFKSVALARLFDSETLVTCFVTARHTNGYVTVFVPTGPNPTSGMIYHLKSTQVNELENISIENAMRSIIGCGIGSEPLLR